VRLRVLAAAVLTLVLGGGIALLAHGTGGGGPVSALRWDKSAPVQVYRLPKLPRDRVVLGRVQNTALKTLRITAARMVIRDAATGRQLSASAAFTTTFAHGLFGAFQQPSSLPTAELLRLGKAVELKPGTSVPFYAAWRRPAGSHGPVIIDYGSGKLVVPEGKLAVAG
jgi:hypothetical protein